MTEEPVPMSRAETQQRTRRDLIEAAREVFLEKGFVGASLADVVERAGYSKGAVYSNFESKEDLALALLGQSSNDEVGDLAANLSTASHEPEFWIDLARSSASDLRGLLVMELSAIARDNEQLRSRLVEGRVEMLESISATLAGDVPPSKAHHDAAAAINAMLSGVAMQHALGPNERLLELFSEFAIQKVREANSAKG